MHVQLLNVTACLTANIKQEDKLLAVSSRISYSLDSLMVDKWADEPPANPVDNQQDDKESKKSKGK